MGQILEIKFIKTETGIFKIVVKYTVLSSLIIKSRPTLCSILTRKCIQLRNRLIKGTFYWTHGLTWLTNHRNGFRIKISYDV